MIRKQINTRTRHVPVPLSFLISTANSFDCEIYMECGQRNVNVKCYDEMIRHLRPSGHSILFCFNGSDELAAQKKIERIFHN
ncbi:MAG: HPr family phosphocarrier protein [Clostridiales bacterium]|nr:HPr family phosphocarrier protein [Clostridiales bacterium]